MTDKKTVSLRANKTCATCRAQLYGYWSGTAATVAQADKLTNQFTRAADDWIKVREQCKRCKNRGIPFGTNR